MRIRSVITLVVHVAIVVFCAGAVWWSVRIAVADLAASENTPEGYKKALRLAPEDPQLRVREALYRSENVDGTDPSVDQDLRLASQMNPYDSEVLMTIGLRAEFRGDTADAEKYLKRAVEVDKQFKPAWTLANYHFRTHQPAKSWPLLEQILHLEPLGFDPAPVFQLAWDVAATGDEVSTSKKVLEIVPVTGERRVQYLVYLMSAKHADAALAEWPLAWQSFNPNNPGHPPAMRQFVNFLMAEGRVTAAIAAWNELIDRGVVNGEKIDASKGAGLGDPEFQYALDGVGFHWRAEDVPGVDVSKISSGLRLEIDGDEPESYRVLSIATPVTAGKGYRLKWNVNGDALNAPHDPGFSFQITDGRGAGLVLAQCGALLTTPDSKCDFLAPTDAGSVRIELRYTRALGTVRPSGVLELASVSLEPAK